MQINNNPVFLPATVAVVNDKQTAAKLPVVYQPEVVSKTPLATETGSTTSVVNAITDESSAREARFVRAFATVSAQQSASTNNPLPSAVKQYVQVASMPLEINNSGRIVDESV